jgi:hypothetical protein
VKNIMSKTDNFSPIMKNISCKCCHQDCGDVETVSCLIPQIQIDGIIYRRSKYHLDEEERRCHDCGIVHGGIHHYECNVEQCPVCLDQLISCDCKDKAYLAL